MKSAIVLATALFTLSAQAGTPARDGSIEALEKGEMKTTAVIMGLNSDRDYPEAPPVLVELHGLAERAAVWIEVQREGARKLPVTVESKFHVRGKSEAVLNVGRLHQVCRTEGTWTISVLVSDAGATKVVASQTFRISHPPRRSSHAMAQVLPDSVPSPASLLPPVY